MALRTVGVRLVAQVGDYVNGMNRARSSTKEFAGELDRAAKSNKLDKLANGAGAMGLALAGGFMVAVNAATKFEKQMSAVQSVSKATSEDMEKLGAAALRAGADTKFSATEAAFAEEELAKAGLDTSEILSGALTGSLALAAAGSIDLAEAASIAAKTMNVFGLSGMDVNHIADVLASAANKSATDVHELGEALKMSGLAANAAGMSLEETVGTLSAFADKALAGSDGGTSLKTAIMMLQAPTDKSAKLMKELGIQAYDASGNFVGTAKLAGNLQTALGSLTQEQRNAALATIFGADGMRAANVLYGLGEQAILDYTRAVDDQGAASRTAEVRMDNLAGDVEKLTGSLETLAITSSGGATSGLRSLVQLADNMVNSLSVLPAGVTNTAVLIAGVGGAGLLAAAGVAKFKDATSGALSALSEVGPRGAKAARGLERFQSGAGKAAIALAAMNVASAAFGSGADVKIDAYGEALADWAVKGKLAGEASRQLGDDMSLLEYDLYSLNSGWWEDLQQGVIGTIEGLTGLGSVFDESLLHAQERLAGLDSALASLVQNGRGEEAAAIFDKIAEKAATQGISVNELTKGLPGYAAALDATKRAADPVVQTQRKLAETAEAMAAGWEGASAEAKGLINLMDQLNGVAITAIKAENDYEEALDAANEGLHAGVGATEAYTAEQRENRNLLLEIVESTKQLVQSRYDDTHSLEQANAVYQQGRAELIRTAMAMGETKASAEALADRIMSMPKLTIGANNSQAQEAVADTLRRMSELKDKSIRISAQVYWTDDGNLHVPGGTQQKRWGGITEHARNGLLREAQTFSAVGSGARYAFAEPATKGEAFVPRSGNRSRSLGILQQAAGWYGHKVMPAGGSVGSASTSGSGTVQVHVTVDGAVQITGTGFLSGLRDEVRLKGGNVQKVIGSGV